MHNLIHLPTNSTVLRAIWSAVRYLLLKIVLIGLTLFFGVFLTVLLINKPAPIETFGSKPQIEASIENQIERYIRAESSSFFSNPTGEEVKKLRAELREEAGLNLPYLPRHLLWTYKALKFDWGRLTQTRVPSLFGRPSQVDIRGIVLQYLPNTLLLAGTANLLVFLVGIPLSLYLARHYGNTADRVLALFSPLSSVPSWVLGILLISIFAVELRWLPISGMYDKLPPETPWGYVPIVVRHMLLPVFAIFISLLFQLVYSWRTYFVIYSEEDYVQLAIAKGLPEKTLQKKYILQPTLPYIITSFALVLVGFWQMTMALEVVFDWPGIGWLYIKQGLPNYWGESMYQGELLIALGVVVIFAYLLGTIVFLLDLIYVLIDPRIHMLAPQNSLQPATQQPSRTWQTFFWLWPHKPQKEKSPSRFKLNLYQRAVSFQVKLAQAWHETWRAMVSNSAYFIKELRHYPSALFGLLILLFLVVGSVTALIIYPYEQIGSLWSTERLTGQVRVPRLAYPEWVNLFREDKLLSVLIYGENSPTVSRQEEKLPNGWHQTTLIYSIEYEYTSFPQEMFLYVDSTYTEKRPFISMKWVTPDGREFPLKNLSVEAKSTYNFNDSINLNRWVSQNPNLQAWFNFGQIDTTPAFHILFADPDSAAPVAVTGVYQLHVSKLNFEADSTVDTELVLLGKVYGLAGTDHVRRELIVPLLWGMPFALIFGLSGALITTVLAMLIAATGVWVGGWADTLVQRLTEANMILPILAMSVLAYTALGLSIWVILGGIILLNVFGTPAKTFRAAFLQIKSAPYIEAAHAYGAGNIRIITKYLVPRILPVLIPQLVTLIPSFVFLEATLGLFNIKSNYPTWGRVIYQGLSNGALYGSRFWVLEPIGLLLLTGFAFSMLGTALERILNPRLSSE